MLKLKQWSQLKKSQLERNYFSDNDIDFKKSDDVFFSTDGKPGDFFFGATMTNDRWKVAASHCYDDFGNYAIGKPRQIRINTIKDKSWGWAGPSSG